VKVSAVIVTKGDVDLGPIVNSLLFDEIIVWDNSQREDDQKVFGRYLAAKQASNEIVYTQDDDCITDAAAIVKEYEDGKVVCNMPLAKREEYATLAPQVGLVGWGACFHRDLTDVLGSYLKRYGKDDLFLRECDRVFTQLNALKFVDVPVRNLPSAHLSNRMGNQPGHLRDLAEITKRVSSLAQ
jgi:hypothetical protein